MKHFVKAYFNIPQIIEPAATKKCHIIHFKHFEVWIIHFEVYNFHFKLYNPHFEVCNLQFKVKKSMNYTLLIEKI